MYLLACTDINAICAVQTTLMPMSSASKYFVHGLNSFTFILSFCAQTVVSDPVLHSRYAPHIKKERIFSINWLCELDHKKIIFGEQTPEMYILTEWTTKIRLVVALSPVNHRGLHQG